MKFSVIVPFLNEEEHLLACIEALRSQDYASSDYELLFVDNGSTDASASIVKDTPMLCYLLEPRQDAYIARNVGAAQARGEILVFIDADCIPKADLLQRYAEAFDDSNVEVAFGRLSFPKDKSVALQFYEGYNRAKMELMASSLPRESCYGHAGNMAIRRDTFWELGGFSLMPIVGDADIVQKYLQCYPTKRFTYVDTAEVTHVEVSSFYLLMKKLYAYGRYSQTYSHHANFRSATIREKLQTFRLCSRQQDYSWLEQVTLVMALALQNLSFITGRLSVDFENLRKAYRV